MASGCLLLNKDGHLLIVKPIYRNDWLLPGGSIENNESPMQGCVREVLEEIGLKKSMLRLLCLEYQSAHSTGTESLQFIFYGGVLSEQEIASIQLQSEEIEEYRFCSRAEALCLLASKLAERMRFGFQALDENRVIYLENKSDRLLSAER